MIRESSYADLIGRIQDDLFVLLQTWKKNFGLNFEATYQGSRNSNGLVHPRNTPDAVRHLVTTAKSRLDACGRFGEASMLLREPREDRLILVHSTSKSLVSGTASPSQVKEPSTYYDRMRHYYYYPLYDRLASVKERESERAREARGLTGWVAVSGHYLLVNGEYGKAGLQSLPSDRPETQGACQVYGNPLWGHHISEAPSDPERPKRYIAVPIRSSTDPGTTIGVLRYACPSSFKELSDPDVALLSELAELIAAVIGLNAAAVRTTRNEKLYHAKDRLRRTYNFQEFLGALANGLRSNIASLYLDVGPLLRVGSQLRLFDAFGVSGAVALQRELIKDYMADTKGFTRWLFDHGTENTPCVESSVHEHPFWRGINTTLFYGEALRELLDFADGSAAGEPTEVARHYVIKIIGVPLLFEEQRIGVLKVELPNTFDDSRHYDESDRKFLIDAAATAAEVLGEFRKFLSCDWFSLPDGDGVHAVVNVTRMAAELLRTRVVSPAEFPALWEGLRDFINRNSDDVQQEMRETIARLTPQDKEVLKQTPLWADKLKGGASETARHILADIVAKIIVESARGY